MFLSSLVSLLAISVQSIYALSPLQPPSSTRLNETEKEQMQNDNLRECYDFTVGASLTCMKLHGQAIPGASCALALSKIPRDAGNRWYKRRHSGRESAAQIT